VPHRESCCSNVYCWKEIGGWVVQRVLLLFIPCYWFQSRSYLRLFIYVHTKRKLLQFVAFRALMLRFVFLSTHVLMQFLVSARSYADTKGSGERLITVSRGSGAAKTTANRKKTAAKAKRKMVLVFIFWVWFPRW